MLIGDAMAYRLALPFLPPYKSEIYHRTLGFRELATKVGPFVTAVGANTVAGEGDDRRTVAALLLLAWSAGADFGLAVA